MRAPPRPQSRLKPARWRPRQNTLSIAQVCPGSDHPAEKDHTPEQAEGENENYERDDEREQVFAKTMAIAVHLPPVYQKLIGCRATKCANSGRRLIVQAIHFDLLIMRKYLSLIPYLYAASPKRSGMTESHRPL
jgi:hypothetical protein